MRRLRLSQLIESQGTIRWLRHLIFWTFHVLYNVGTWGVYNDHVQQSLVMESFSLIGKILMAYYVLYYLLPQFLLPKIYSKFIVRCTIALICAGLLNRAITYYICYPIFYPEAVGSGYWRIKIFFEMTAIVNVTALATAFKLLQYWYNNERSRKNLAQQKIEAELKLLKSQVHPHFLFNTLNNLYALTLDNSAAAPEVVIKLSALLNYMLYECNADMVPVSKELEYIQDYITLEQLRYGDRLELSLEISGNPGQKNMAPLILIPFIENSFTHGASKETRCPWIHLNIWITDAEIWMQLENSKVVDYQAGDDNVRGIGLANVKRRLDLLYQDRYELKIINEESYLVNLKLQLERAQDAESGL